MKICYQHHWKALDSAIISRAIADRWQHGRGGQSAFQTTMFGQVGYQSAPVVRSPSAVGSTIAGRSGGARAMQWAILRDRTADSVVASSRQSDEDRKEIHLAPSLVIRELRPGGEERQRQSDRGVGERARSERTKWESDTLCSRRPMIVATRKNTVGV